MGGDKFGEESRTVDWLLRGLANCAACERRVTPLPSSKASRRHHSGFYVCRRRLYQARLLPTAPRCTEGRYLRRDEADPVIEQLTLARLGEPRSALLAPPPSRPNAPDFDAKRADIAVRRKRLVAAVASGKLRLEDIDAHIRELETALDDVEAEAAAYAVEIAGDSAESRRAALAFVENVEEAWAGLTPPERRSVIATLAARIVVPVSGAVLEVTWREASGLAVAVGEAEPEPAPVPRRQQRSRHVMRSPGPNEEQAAEVWTFGR